MTSPELFLTDKDLSNYWVAISRSPQFAKVLVYARSALLEQGPSHDEIKGAERVLHILSTICDSPPEPFQFPSPHLHHDLDVKPNLLKLPEEKE